MRTKRATRFSREADHNSYGIYNWLRLKGIKNIEVMKEVMYAFCQKNEFKGLDKNTSEVRITNFCGNRFQVFATFAIQYLKENNYL